MVMNVSVYTPRKVICEHVIVDEILLPGLDGPIGILENHVPMITLLEVGLLKIKSTSTQYWTPFLLDGGVAEIENNKITVLAMEVDDFIAVDELSKAIKKLDTAKETLRNLINSNNENKEYREQACIEVKKANALVDGIKCLPKNENE